VVTTFSLYAHFFHFHRDVNSYFRCSSTDKSLRNTDLYHPTFCTPEVGIEMLALVNYFCPSVLGDNCSFSDVSYFSTLLL
jgi:hypothetical protein